MKHAIKHPALVCATALGLPVVPLVNNTVYVWSVFLEYINALLCGSKAKASASVSIIWSGELASTIPSTTSFGRFGNVGMNVTPRMSHANTILI